MRIETDKNRELLKRLKILERKMENLKKPFLIIDTDKRCFHAEVECACNCGKHSVARVEKFWTRAGNCTCRQFHKPPKKPCGCLTMEEIRSIDVYSNISKPLWPTDNGNMLQRVPGMFSFISRYEFDSFKLYREGDHIIKKSEEAEEIIATIPYINILKRFGASP